MTKMDWEVARRRDLVRKWREERPRQNGRRPKGRPKRCAGTTKAGKPCQGMAKTGHDLCGPHLMRSGRRA